MATFDHYTVYKTYSGCYEGAPPTDKMLEIVKNRVTRHWGDRAIHIVNPEARWHSPFEEQYKEVYAKHGKSYPANDMLPSWTHCAWCNGPAKDPDDDGTELVIVWFSDEPGINLADVINKVDWDTHAKGFGF